MLSAFLSLMWALPSDHENSSPNQSARLPMSTALESRGILKNATPD